MDLAHWAKVKEAKELGLQVKQWNNMPSFMCPHCQYDDLNLDRLKGHIARAHEVPKVQKKTVHIVDTKGNKILY